MNRNRLPRIVNAAIDAIADAPMSPLGKLAARRLGTPPPRGSVLASDAPDAEVRVLIAPVNYSGQGREWARALERSDPRIAARNMAVDVPGGFSFDADLIVPVATYHNDSEWQERQLAAAKRFTHVLVEAEEPPFGRALGRSVEAQVQALRTAGVSVAYLGHGTDVRLPSRHIANTPLSYYSDPSLYLPRAEAVAQRNIDLIARSALPTFVSTPDLLLDIPDAAWCPVVVDPERWENTRVPRRAGAPLRVAHAPSVAAAKGTDLIMPALTRLADEGVIELELAQGVPSARMPDVFARADVVLDQFRAGSYGVAACEALASGCLVVGSVTPGVRADVAARTKLTLPILEADPTTLEGLLRDLAAAEELDKQREEGRAFVRAVHDGRMSARALLDHWISADTTKAMPHAPTS